MDNLIQCGADIRLHRNDFWDILDEPWVDRANLAALFTRWKTALRHVQIEIDQDNLVFVLPNNRSLQVPKFGPWKPPGFVSEHDMLFVCVWASGYGDGKGRKAPVFDSVIDKAEGSDRFAKKIWEELEKTERLRHYYNMRHFLGHAESRFAGSSINNLADLLKTLCFLAYEAGVMVGLDGQMSQVGFDISADKIQGREGDKMVISPVFRRVEHMVFWMIAWLDGFRCALDFPSLWRVKGG